MSKAHPRDFVGSVNFEDAGEPSYTNRITITNPCNNFNLDVRTVSKWQDIEEVTVSMSLAQLSEVIEMLTSARAHYQAFCAE